MMFVCHICKSAAIKLPHRFEDWEAITAHRAEAHPFDFVHGVPFWMCEVKLLRSDYYWVARQLRDKRWLDQWVDRRVTPDA